MAERLKRRWWAIALGICWTVLVAQASCLVAGVWSLGTGGYMDAEMQQWAVGVGNRIVMGGFALALAPWIVGGIVLGVRWWRSRASEGSDDTERDAG